MTVHVDDSNSYIVLLVDASIVCGEVAMSFGGVRYSRNAKILATFEILIPTCYRHATESAA
jgi:hypothetical protein